MLACNLYGTSRSKTSTSSSSITDHRTGLSAIDRHIRERADELSRKAKLITTKVNTILRNTKRVEAIVKPTTVEILSTVYADLKARRKRPQSTQAPKQKELF